MNEIYRTKTARATPSLARSIAIATIAVALLDATDGVVYFWLTAHRNPIEVLQYIASGAFGDAAYSGGLATAFAGLVFHFIISFAAVYAFVMLYTRSPFVRGHAPVAGLAYGVVVWCFMNLVVLPASAVTPTALTTLGVVHGIIGHAVFVGLPAALCAGWKTPSEVAIGQVA